MTGGRLCKKCKAVEHFHDAYLKAWSKPHHDFEAIPREDDDWWRKLLGGAEFGLRHLIGDYSDAFTEGERRDLEHALIIIEERDG